MPFWACFSSEKRGLVGVLNRDGEGVGEYDEDMARDDDGDDCDGDETMPGIQVALLAETRRPVCGLVMDCMRFILSLGVSCMMDGRSDDDGLKDR